MEPLLWLLVPLAAALGASLWAWYVSRPHPADVWTDVDRYDRLRASLAPTAVPAPRARVRTGSGAPGGGEPGGHRRERPACGEPRPVLR
ncbi:hypothetical protein LUX01_03360 [Streptomyces sudanensis]|uniref:hypothetical protein n=1 Tax=Streptomyces sudanensis TaxID=436397 RepID=UPI0020CD860E|nr:hypothetical protein [Streptomyces sudanensis]MCP9985882.1 hypothetical protein [Streptomyces sudanensis]